MEWTVYAIFGTLSVFFAGAICCFMVNYIDKVTEPGYEKAKSRRKRKA